MYTNNYGRVFYSLTQGKMGQTSKCRYGFLALGHECMPSISITLPIFTQRLKLEHFSGWQGKRQNKKGGDLFLLSVDPGRPQLSFK